MQKKKTKASATTRPRTRKKRALGMGLDALIPEIEPSDQPASDFFECAIAMIQPNPFQPRMRFATDELAELAESIKEQGVIQPLVVRKTGNGYELVTGERRLRASKMAGLDQVPVVVKVISDAQMLEMSIVENIQRQNLNPIEEAEAYYRLMTEFSLTQDQAAQRVGKSRPAVANFLRLRQLPEQIKNSLLDNTLSMGHARALLGAENQAQQLAVWQAIKTQDLSVRQTENMVRRLKKTAKKRPAPASDSEQAYFMNLEEDLSRRFGTKVKIRRQGQKGKVEIAFFNDGDLDRLLNLLTSG
jgi:ParB family chromosome partitioning protein